MKEKLEKKSVKKKSTKKNKPSWYGKKLDSKLIMDVSKQFVNRKEFNRVVDIAGSSYLLTDEELKDLK